MLSVFPELFNYSQIAPFLLRVSLGIVLIRFGYLAVFKTAPATKYEKAIGIVWILSALFFFLGLLTQVAGLLTIVTVFKINQKILKFMILVIALSLIFLGPGLFSFDLPL